MDLTTEGDRKATTKGHERGENEGKGNHGKPSLVFGGYYPLRKNFLVVGCREEYSLERGGVWN